MGWSPVRRPIVLNRAGCIGKIQTYVSGLAPVTGLGVADDLQSLMVFTDPLALGLNAVERRIASDNCNSRKSIEV